MSGRWHAAIAWALTGESMDLGDQDAPDPEALAAGLADHGWDEARLAEHAREASASGVWPHPIPDAVRAGLGAAQLHAAIRSAREHLGLAVLSVRAPSRRTSLNADERRLLADVPPHYGRD
ncbi:MAG: hypothetical protein QM708_10835 [Propioniciclava sp.]|uniref:hypothetical protein n=1 Tax=Propioniciclava sp. TaxID=2038686 RepID=UPI0039E4C9B9